MSEDNTTQVSSSGGKIMTGTHLAKIKAEIQARFKDVRVKQRELITPSTLDGIRRRFAESQQQPRAESVLAEAECVVEAVPQNKRRVSYTVQDTEKPADQLYTDALRSLGFAKTTKANPLAISATSKEPKKKWWQR